MTRRATVRLALLSSLLLCPPVPAHAQLSANNLAIVQAGNTLFTRPRDRTDLYDQLNLVWRAEGFAAGGRFELDRSSDDRPDQGRLAAYDRVTQRWAAWEGPHADLRVGNFYTLLGHGLLHRSWELPGVVYDESGSRTRYAAARDLDGAIAHANAGPLAAQLFGGRVNDATVSPASEALGLDRYQGFLQGAQLESRLPRGGRVGAAWTHFSFGDAPAREAATGFFGFDPLALAGVRTLAAPLYFEYAEANATPARWAKLRRGPEVPHAMYGSLDLLWNAFTLAAEFKDYDHFRLGTNDPPSLVREHSAPLLNRTTHVLDAEGETGFALEGSAPATRWAAITANFSRSDGAPGIRRLRFEERYAELRVAPPDSDLWDASVFTDRGFDTFDFVSDRHAVGLLAGCRLPRGFSLALDAERTRSVRAPFFGAPVAFEDRLLAFTCSRSGWGSAGVSFTRTTDPQDLPTDDLGAPTKRSVVFTGVNASAEIDARNRLTLFAGRRRGGRACTSGTCYEVPSLDGAELRWETRY